MHVYGETDVHGSAMRYVRVVPVLGVWRAAQHHAHRRMHILADYVAHINIM